MHHVRKLPKRLGPCIKERVDPADVATLEELAALVKCSSSSPASSHAHSLASLAASPLPSGNPAASLQETGVIADISEAGVIADTLVAAGGIAETPVAPKRRIMVKTRALTRASSELSLMSLDAMSCLATPTPKSRKLQSQPYDQTPDSCGSSVYRKAADLLSEEPSSSTVVSGPGCQPPQRLLGV